jgi:hypothetical protein
MLSDLLLCFCILFNNLLDSVHLRREKVSVKDTPRGVDLAYAFQ